MKASDTMKAVKRWFKLSNYAVLEEITVNDLSYEISRRVSLHRHDFGKGRIQLRSATLSRQS